MENTKLKSTLHQQENKLSRFSALSTLSTQHSAEVARLSTGLKKVQEENITLKECVFR